MPIYENQTASPIIESFYVNGQKRTFKIDPGAIEETPYILTDQNLTKTNDFPRYNPIYAQETVTSTGPGDNKTVTINMKASSVSIFNSGSANVLAFLGIATNYPGIPCHPNTERIIEIDHNVEQIILQFDAAGSVYVEQRA